MKLHTQTLKITLLDDCVFSKRAATEGAHETIDRVPGTALLGAAAAQLYAQLTTAESDTVFHSGRFRFCDGLPLSAGEPAWPVPMCWHHAKDDWPRDPESAWLYPTRIYNFLHVDAIPRCASDGTPTAQRTQPKQMRDGYVSAHGRLVRPALNYRMKTAISAQTGRAAESQLFGYSALQRGQTFLARVEADADVDAALFARVIGALHGQVLLGRSRSAEYGRAQIEPVTPAAPTAQAGIANGQTLVLWLLSDLAPCDAWGQPTHVLDAEALGLPEGSRVLWDKTYTRAGSYSPWNAKRHGYDAERRVLLAGGVITVQLPASADPAACVAQLQHGIGLHREAGLGQVWVNPPLLSSIHPDFITAPTAADPKPAQPTKPDHPLADWILQHHSADSSNAESQARRIEEEYLPAIEAARRALGYPDFATDFYPSRAQWGSVYEAARTRSDEALYRALFVGDDAVIKPTGKGWGLELPPGKEQPKQWQRLCDWLREQIGANQRCDALLVRQLARRLMNHPEKRKV